MKKYEIIKTYNEFTYRERERVKTGCTLWENNYEVLESFKTLDEAKEALQKYKTDVWEGSAYGGGSLAVITEYSIQENEYDEDGEWYAGGDVNDITELPYNPWGKGEKCL